MCLKFVSKRFLWNVPCGKGGHADGQASAEMGVAGVRGVLAGVVELAIDDNRRDQTVDTQHT